MSGHLCAEGTQLEASELLFECKAEIIDDEIVLTVRGRSRHRLEVLFNSGELAIRGVDSKEAQTFLIDLDSSGAHTFHVTEVWSAMPTITLRSLEETPSKAQSQIPVNLAEIISGRAIGSRGFQALQTALPHSVLIDMSASGCRFEDILPEVLSRLKMSVVIDRQTSNSRTCWLSGQILNKPVLIVLDVARERGADWVSLDVWSELKDIEDAVLEVIADTRIGETVRDFADTEVSWSLDRGGDGDASLAMILSLGYKGGAHDQDHVVFTLDYQGLISESFEAFLSQEQDHLSVAIDLTGIMAEWTGSLEDPYVIVYLTDSTWKNISRSHVLSIDWERALTQQLQRRLATGTRFSNLRELSEVLNLDPNGDDSLAIFTSFCLHRDLTGCKGNRISGHCSRAAILTGLVICFNPARGLSGYLDMVTGPTTLPFLADYGTPRTWRDHITQIAQMTSDFKPQPVKLEEPSRRRSKGRPPTQLMPTTPPLDLFHLFVETPERIVCKYCRFFE